MTLTCFHKDVDPSVFVEVAIIVLWFLGYVLRTEYRNKILKELLIRSTEAKTEFLARMSHQLRTPVFGIVGSLELLQGEGLNRSQISTLKVIRNCCDNLLTTVSDILDFSKIEYKTMTLNETVIDLQELITSCTEVFESQIKEKSISLKKVIEYPIPRYIIADNTRLKQVLVNLLSNSVKFTNKGGSITLKVSTNYKPSSNNVDVPNPNHAAVHVPKDRKDVSINGDAVNEVSNDNPLNVVNKDYRHLNRMIEVKRTSELGTSSLKDKSMSKPSISQLEKSCPASRQTLKDDSFIIIGNLYFTISDTGIGIKKSIQKKIFDPFFRTDSFPEECNEGIGLGLTMAKYFVEEMEGAFHFHSRGSHKGSTFSFNVPYKVPNNSEPLKQCTTPNKLLRSSTEGNIMIQRAGGQHNNVSAEATPLRLQSRMSLVKSTSNDRVLVPTSVPLLPIDKNIDESSQSDYNKVLIVEDNCVNRKIIKRMISKAGFSVDMAENGFKALELCQKRAQEGNEYVAILMDIEMPFMGGLEATQKIRNELQLRTPIIALSAHALVEIRDKALQVGVDGFVTKPFSYKTLVDEISIHTDPKKNIKID